MRAHLYGPGGVEDGLGPPLPATYEALRAVGEQEAGTLRQGD
jgi:hypothetical protein